MAALGCQFEPPPDGYGNRDDYWRAAGVSEDELGPGLDCIVDPAGRGPRIWFQVVPENKTLKNRLHLDITVSGGRANPVQTRRRLVNAQAQQLEALGATLVTDICQDGIDHYGVANRMPRATSSTSTDGHWPGAGVAQAECDIRLMHGCGSSSGQTGERADREDLRVLLPRPAPGP